MAVSVGTQGTVTSWSATVTSAYLANIIPNTVNWSMNAPSVEVTPLNATNKIAIASLGDWNGSINGFGDISGAFIGDKLSVAFSAGGYATHVRSLQFEVAPIAVHDITSADTVGGSGENWKAFRPDRAIMGTWSFEAMIDDTTAIANPIRVGDSIPSLTLTYATNASVAGSAIVESVTPNVSVGGVNTVTYSGTFTGAITPAGVSSLFATTAFAEPESGGTLLWSSSSSKTYSGTAFWSRIALTAAIDQAVTVNINFQGTGALTIG